jgi:glycosyltransferase involved in cell wall biosynthesis
MLLPEAYSWIKRVHSAHLIPRYARRLDALVTVSETSRRWFAEHYRVPPERIHVTYNACSPAYRRLGPEELAAPEAIPAEVAGAIGEAPFVLHVSRFSERKNPWTMLAAFADLVAGIEVERQATTPGGNGSSGPEEDPSIPEDLRLVLAGKGWDGDAVWARARELGIADRLVTPGFVAEETVVHLLNRAALFWFPSLSEGFGMPNIEAMRCGCPVITSAVFAIPEVVGHAAIVLADPRNTRGLADATREIITDPARREALIAAGLTWSGRYSWDASARVLADVFRGLARR